MAVDDAPTLSLVLRSTGSELAARATALNRDSSNVTVRDDMVRAASSAAGVLHLLAVALEGATWTIGDGH